MEKDENVIAGNLEDLQEFKKHFGPHDRRTLDVYAQHAWKKKAVMVVRRWAANAPQMQILTVGYKAVELCGGLRESLKKHRQPIFGWIKMIPVDPIKIFVFGELIPKNDGEGFTKPYPFAQKRKPFGVRGLKNGEENQKEKSRTFKKREVLK